MSQTTAILGASGYAGGELIRLLDAHPEFEVAYLGAHSRAGSRLGEVHPHLDGGERLLQDGDDIPEVELAFLALPHGASARIGSRLAGLGIRVVDLGSDFRMDTPDRYNFAYGAPHPAPEELSRWAYGLPELFRSRIASSRLVASPGCYPTAALLGLAPPAAAGVLELDRITVNAVSGVSGAGRSLREDLMFGAVAEGARAYGIAGHRHRPEIEMGLELLTGSVPQVTFTPHLIPIQRGILATTTAPIVGGVSEDDLRSIFEEAYREEPFVEVSSIAPQSRWVAGSNRAVVAAYLDSHTGMAVIVSAIDNLIKGAAGQAIQAANIMVGLPETTGLPTAGMMS